MSSDKFVYSSGFLLKDPVTMRRLLSLSGLVLLVSMSSAAQLRVATFEADVTPPIGAPLCNGGVMPAKKIIAPLSARGVVILNAGRPIVLCAFDWVGIGSGAHVEYRKLLAEAAGTVPERVTVHTLHQHDAPAADYSTEDLIKTVGLSGFMFDPVFAARW